MKDIFLKKVIPIISIVVVVISLFCFSVCAETYWLNISPATMFAHFNHVQSNVVTVNDGQANQVFDGTDYIYYINVNESNYSGIFINLNFKDSGVTLKKGINYSFRFKVIIPTAYAPQGASKFTWSDWYTAGLYSYKSVSYSSAGNYICSFTSPQFENVGANGLSFPSYPAKVPGSSVALSYFDLVGEFTPNTDTNIMSFGCELPVLGSGWHGWIGVGGLQVGMPSEYAPLPGGTPDYETDNSDNMHDLENNINNQNQSNIQASTNLFNSFNGILDTNSSLIKGLAGVTYIFNRLFMNVPWIQNLLTFSLTLGLIAFLLGSGVAIYTSHVNKGLRRERRAAAENRTEAYRQARLEALRRRKR